MEAVKKGPMPQNNQSLAQLMAELVEVSSALLVAHSALNRKMAMKTIENSVSKKIEGVKSMAESYGRSARKYAEEQTQFRDDKETAISKYQKALGRIGKHYDSKVNAQLEVISELDTKWHESIATESALKKARRAAMKTPEYQAYRTEVKEITKQLVQASKRGDTEQVQALNEQLARKKQENPLQVYNDRIGKVEEDRDGIEAAMADANREVERLQAERQTRIEKADSNKANALAARPKQNLFQRLGGLLFRGARGAKKFHKEVVSPYLEEVGNDIQVLYGEAKGLAAEKISNLVQKARDAQTRIDRRTVELNTDKETATPIVEADKTTQGPETPIEETELE